MTQDNENGSRLNRIEALMLELATASVRHDNESSHINATLDRLAERQDRIAEQQEQNNRTIARLAEQQEQNNRAIAQLTAEQQLGRQDINTLTANIEDLRNLVADYLQGRSHS